MSGRVGGVDILTDVPAIKSIGDVSNERTGWRGRYPRVTPESGLGIEWAKNRRVRYPRATPEPGLGIEGGRVGGFDTRGWPLIRVRVSNGRRVCGFDTRG